MLRPVRFRERCVCLLSRPQKMRLQDPLKQGLTTGQGFSAMD